MTKETKKKEQKEKIIETVQTTESSSIVSADEKNNKEKVVQNSSKKRKKIKRFIQKGQAHIQCTYNNTVITISDLQGAVLGWSSSGLLGFKGAKKSTPYAATQVAGNVAEKIKKYEVSELEIYVKGVGSGREAAIRSLMNKGFNISLIKDITPVPHNGCRPRKPRRV